MKPIKLVQTLGAHLQWGGGSRSFVLELDLKGFGVGSQWFLSKTC